MPVPPSYDLDPPAPGAGGQGIFASTEWTVVLSAGGVDSPAARAALERLCRVYWFPLYAHVRRRGYKPEDAQDLTQEFFAHLFRHESLAGVRREKGRFRVFLLSALNYFLSDQRDRACAAKRGGGRACASLDALQAEERYALEPATSETPDRAFDRRWAAALMEQVFAQLRQEQLLAGKNAQFTLLQPFLAREVEPGEYEALEPRLGLSRNAIAAAVRRLRLRCRELALAEVMRTVALPSEAEAELRQLFS